MEGQLRGAYAVEERKEGDVLFHWGGVGGEASGRAPSEELPKRPDGCPDRIRAAGSRLRRGGAGSCVTGMFGGGF
eukprot:10729605-Heterocapsa_arctica.AAC.1